MKLWLNVKAFRLRFAFRNSLAPLEQTGEGPMHWLACAVLHLKPRAISLPLRIPSRQAFHGAADFFLSEENAVARA